MVVIKEEPPERMPNRAPELRTTLLAKVLEIEKLPLSTELPRMVALVLATKIPANACETFRALPPALTAS